MEYLDIVDKNGVPTGATVERKTAHREGVRHRTAHVWVVRQGAGGWEILLQKRALSKESFPGCFDTSSAGHITAGDEPLSSAMRELYEELGICAEPSDLPFVGTFDIEYDKEFYGAMFRDREVAFVYCYRKTVEIDKLTLQIEEVDSVKWFSLTEVLREKEAHNHTFCVPIDSLKLIDSYLAKLPKEDA